MNRRFLSVVAFALAVSAAVSLLIYRMVVVRVNATSRLATASVIVAARNLAIGSLIRESDLKRASWSGPAPPRVVPNASEAIGRGVLADIYEGEPIVETRLAPKGAGAGLAATIAKGMRAVAVHVNDVVGVAGFVVPGMRVDVLVSGNSPGSRNETGTQTRTVLQNIEVLSAGHNIQKDAEGKPVSVPVVNLAVTPEEAEILSLAGSETKIQLVLRNPLDKDKVKTPGTALASLFGGRPAQAVAPQAKVIRRPAPAAKPVAAPPPPPPPPQFKVVEVLHGTKRAETKFEKAMEAKQ